MSHGLHMSMMIGEMIILEAEKHNARFITEIDIELGKLSCFSKEQIETYLLMRLENTVAEGAEVNIKEIIPEAFCETCSFEGELREAPQFNIGIEFYEPRCPRCNSSDITLIKGKECKLTQIKLI